MSIDYLVTGATGLLGNNLVRQLLAQGKRVRVLARETSSRRPLAGLDVERVIGDVTQAESVRAAMRDVRCVIHAAADTHIGWRDLERQRLINVQGTLNTAAAAREFGARLVHVSSVDALAAAATPQQLVDESTPDACKLPCTYVVTKRQAEQEVRRQIELGLDAVIVNPGFMLGPWDWKPSSGRMLLSLSKGWTPAAPVGGMSGCDARDVAQATIAAAERAPTGRNFILAGENLSYLSAWRLFAREAGRPVPLFRMGPLVRYAIGYGGDLWARVSGQERDINSAMLRMSGMYHYYSSDLARRELGYASRPFTETVRDAWQWLREYHYAPPDSRQRN